MGKSLVGDVVVVPFPQTDLAAGKRRPALVVATFSGDDLVLVQITTRPTSGPYAISIGASDFVSGSLQQASFVRTNRLFTVDQAVIAYTIGKLTDSKIKQVLASLRQMFSEKSALLT